MSTGEMPRTEHWWPSRYRADDQIGSLNEVTAEASLRGASADRRVALTGCDTWSYGPVPAEDPASSVLDVDCNAHDLDNLYIADVGLFVSSTAVNPTLTNIANALRPADRIADRLGPPIGEPAGMTTG